MPDKTKLPIGVKVISILYYIVAVLGIIYGLSIFVEVIRSLASPAERQFLLVEDFSILVIGIAGVIILIGLGVLGFFVGRGLWKARNWARIVAIIFAVLGIVWALRSIIQNYIINSRIFLDEIVTIFNISMVVNGIIGGYLLFSNKVKRALKLKGDGS